MPFRYQPDDDDNIDQQAELDYDEPYEIPFDIEAAIAMDQAELDEMVEFFNEPHQQKQQTTASPYFASYAKSSTAYAPSKLDKGKEREVLDLDDYEDEIIDSGHGASSSGSIVNSAEIDQLTKEIASYDAQIRQLQASRADLAKQREEQARIAAEQAKTKQKSSLPTANGVVNRRSAPAAHHTAGPVDYSDSSRFPWKDKLQNTLKTVFGINQLRLCQEGVLNAVLDGRDAICIMPTGGGKSVCFQAPALLSSGCTLVISPLISLMTDQVMHLTEKGVEAVMLTGSTKKDDDKEISRRLLLREGMSREKCIKLCYVTPEKMVKSKKFQSLLSKMHQAGLLSRIAIDESHCCSQMGHDFRPDYKKLSMLRSLYPKVPIVALTATCGKSVLNDVIRILGLQQCTPGTSASRNGTVFFSAPLYRSNLHYSVRSKPTNVQDAIKLMADEILLKHEGKTGIIYVLSKADTVTVASGLRELSGGKIKTGTYHAGMDDREKQEIHEKWRAGKVKCVVATIAFGMGIDAPDVRYVFHHCMSKSMEGYYQETGRAGRDGKDSDCVLWFRGQDASRLSALSVGTAGGLQKVYTMLAYSLDYTTCRKLLFDDYFGDPAKVVAPFADSTRVACGHCDNCLRLSEENLSSDSSVAHPVTRDVTVEAWKICKIIAAMANQGGNVTLSGACDLARGLNKCAFPTENRGQKGKGFLDLEKECGGKVKLSKDDMEVLMLKMLIGGYIDEFFYNTVYSTISYIVPSSSTASTRYTRIRTLEEFEKKLDANEVPKMELTTLEKKSKRGGKKSAKKKGGQSDSDAESEDQEPPKKKRKAPVKKTGKRGEEGDEETGDSEAPSGKTKKKAAPRKKTAKQVLDEVLGKTPAPTKQKTKAPGIDDSSDVETDTANGYFNHVHDESPRVERRSEDIDEDSDDGVAELSEWQKMRNKKANGSKNGNSHGNAGDVIDLDSN